MRVIGFPEFSAIPVVRVAATNAAIKKLSLEIDHILSKVLLNLCKDTLFTDHAMAQDDDLSISLKRKRDAEPQPNLKIKRQR